METITSVNNSKVKMLKSLQTKKGRRESGLFLVEGFNLIKDIPAHIHVVELVIRDNDYDKYIFLESKFRIDATILSSNVFDSISDTVSSNGIIAVVETVIPKSLTEDRVIVLDSINDAGNYGTIVRTAVAMGFTDIIAIDSVESYNSKVIRASMGGIFHSNIIETDVVGALEILKDYKKIILDFGEKSIYSYTFPKKMAIVVGNEVRGINSEIKRACDDVITIPMPSAKIESLNAGVSMSILISLVANSSK